MIESSQPLPPASELVTAFVATPEVGSEATGFMRVESLSFDLPVEIETSADGDVVTGVGIAPPTQIVRTTVMPVFHRLRVTIIEPREW